MMAVCTCCGAVVPDDKLLVDLNTNQISYGGQSVSVSGRAIELAAVLAERSPSVVARELLAERVFGANEPSDASNTLTQHAHILRKAISPLGWRVLTVVNRGYRLVPHVEREAICRSQ